MSKYAALITGASSGIGLELARVFAREGYDVIIVARSKEKLKSVAKEIEHDLGRKVLTIVEDLSEVEASTRVMKAVKKAGWKVEVLVNNAGFGLFGHYWETDGDTETNMIDLNIRALSELTKLVLPEMLKRKSGYILNVGSVAGFLPGPFSVVYYASKAYVLSYTEGLANELRGTGVSASVLCPGPVATGFEKRAKYKGVFPKQLLISARTVAERGFKGLMRGQVIIIPEFRLRFMIFFIRISPRWFVSWVSRKIIS